MTRFGRILMWLGGLGLVIGFGPLAVVAVIDPKSTAVGPGLLMLLMVPPSVLCLGLGWALRKFGRNRDERRAGEAADGARGGDFWRGEPGEPVRHDRHDRAA